MKFLKELMLMWQFFWGYKCWKRIRVSNKISSSEENYIYIYGYLYCDNKIKPLYIILLKTSAQVKCHDDQSKWCIFWLKMMNFWKNIILLGLNSVLALRINLIASLSTVKNSENQNKISGWRSYRFSWKKSLKMDFNNQLGCWSQ